MASKRRQWKKKTRVGLAGAVLRENEEFRRDTGSPGFGYTDGDRGATSPVSYVCRC